MSRTLFELVAKGKPIIDGGGGGVAVNVLVVPPHTVRAVRERAQRGGAK